MECIKVHKKIMKKLKWLNNKLEIPKTLMSLLIKAQVNMKIISKKNLILIFQIKMKKK